MTDGFTHDTDPPIEDVPEQPTPPAEPVPAPAPSDEVVVIPPAEPAEEPAVEPVAEPAEEPAAEPAESVAEPVAEPAAEPAESVAEPVADAAAGEEFELPEDLRAVTEALEQPTGQLTAVAAEGEPAAEDETAAAEGEGEPAAEGDAAAAEGDGESLADIAPGTVTEAEGEEAAEEPELAGPRMTVPWWPFITYVLLWIAGAAYLVYELQLLPAGQASYEAPLYHTSMLVALGMLGFGPLLVLIVWISAWIGYKSDRVGSLFISAFVKGAGSTLIGAVVWIAALIITDYLRLGRPF